MTKKIVEHIIEVTRYYGFLNETAEKYYNICARYNELRRKKKTTEQIELILSKEFGMEPETIHSIYYHKAKRILNPEIIKFVSLDESVTKASEKD